MSVAFCQRCELPKPVAAFHRHSGNASGCQAWCKDCHNTYQRNTRKRRETPDVRHRNNLKARYGITETECAALLVAQGGLCAICSKPPKHPVLDHSHATGALRGILCHGCNIKLHAIEDGDYLANALRYLRGGQ